MDIGENGVNFLSKRIMFEGEPLALEYCDKRLTQNLGIGRATKKARCLAFPRPFPAKDSLLERTYFRRYEEEFVDVLCAMAMQWRNTDRPRQPE